MSIVEHDRDLIPAISHGPFTATPTGLVIDESEPIPYDLWERYGEGLRRVEAAVQWVIGDWLNYGERAYGDTYSQALDATDYEYKSLSNMKYVAGNVAISRRRDNLSWSHHAAVASLTSSSQDKYLETAEYDRLSVNDLRTLIAADNSRYDPKPTYEELEAEIERLKLGIKKALEQFAYNDHDAAYNILSDLEDK